jgi:hypothetical protein
VYRASLEMRGAPRRLSLRRWLRVEMVNERALDEDVKRRTESKNGASQPNMQELQELGPSLQWIRRSRVGMRRMIMSSEGSCICESLNAGCPKVRADADVGSVF